MADAASIGANLSNYTGNAALGGGVIDPVKIDTKPLEQLAQYTMLYNKAEYDQRQKDAEAAAKEIADATKYDLNTSIPKDAKIVQDKYNALQEYLRNNPDAVNYRNQEKWAEYKRLRNDLEQDLSSAKARSILHMSRKEEIAKETNPELKKLMEEELERDIQNTDIRTPLPHSQKYEVKMPEIPKGVQVQFDVFKKGANQDFKRDFTLFDVKKARQDANVFAMGLDDATRSSRKIIKQTTDDRGLISVVFEENGQEKALDFLSKEEFDREFNPSGASSARTAIALKNNFWVQGANTFNAAIGQYKNADGSIDETKIKGLSKELLGLIKKTNDYLETKASEIKAGVYTDNMGKTVSFGNGMLDEDDYQPINWQDGISPDELALVGAYATWAGDNYKTNAIQTNDELEQQRLAQQKWAIKYEQAQANYRATLGGGSTTTPESRNFVDFTRATPSDLSITDLAAINPNWVTNENGVLKLTPEGIAAKSTIKIDNSNGNVTYEVTSGKGTSATTTSVSVPKETYQKNAVTVTQTVLKDRKGEQGNPFTFRPSEETQGPTPSTGTGAGGSTTSGLPIIRR